MVADKSLSYYGWLYHKLFDPPLAEARDVVVDLVAPASSVIDIGCGTGQLCIALTERKQCRVVGVDLSLEMLRFAERTSVGHGITFRHLDATNLAGIEDRAFEYATVLFVLHELPREKQMRVLDEALRVASRVVMVDSHVPLPWNLSGLGVRFVEATFGREHNPHFRRFLAEGGIPAIVAVLGRPLEVLHRSVFWRGCRELVVVGANR